LRNQRPSTAKALLCLAIAGGLYLQIESIRTGSRDPQPADPSEAVEVTVPAALAEDVSAARRLLGPDPDTALRHIERALERAEGADPKLRALLLSWAADVHARRFHLHRARDALTRAIELAPTDARRYWLANLEEAILRSEGEHELMPFYYAVRGAGPAKELRGRVVVVYLLVDPEGPGRWTDVDRAFARSTLRRVERWYAEKAEARGVRALEFVDRIFQLPVAAGELPLLRNVNFARGTAWKLANNLGHDSVGQLLAALAAEERAEQVLFLVHSPQRARSFATPCGRMLGYCDGEIAFIYEPNGPSTWDSLAFTLAHEGLHLFGADDLYNVRGAEDYEPTDVMHHQSANLKYADVGDLTAWAVGWARDRPITPFPVEE